MSHSTAALRAPTPTEMETEWFQRFSNVLCFRCEIGRESLGVNDFIWKDIALSFLILHMLFVKMFI